MKSNKTKEHTLSSRRSFLSSLPFLQDDYNFRRVQYTTYYYYYYDTHITREGSVLGRKASLVFELAIVRSNRCSIIHLLVRYGFLFISIHLVTHQEGGSVLAIIT